MTLSSVPACIVLYTLLQEFVLGSPPKHFVLVPTSNGHLYNGYTNATVGPNMEDCAVLCKEFSQCNSFTFSNLVCYFYATAAPFLRMSTNLSNAITYRNSPAYKHKYCGGNFTKDSTGTLCFKIMDGVSYEMSFLDALSICIGMNSVLASLDSVDKLKKYQDVINAQSGFLYSNVWWVGGYDLGGQNKDWQWVNGQPVNPSFWYSNEPNGYDEECAEAHGVQLKLNDMNCNRQQNFICEKNIV